MQASIFGQLGVKGSHEDGSLTTDHWARSGSSRPDQPGRSEHLHLGTDGLHYRGPDEDRVHRTARNCLHHHVALERLRLTAIAVAPYEHVHHPERLLIGTPIDHASSQQDKTSARPKGRQTAVERFGERPAKTGRVEQHGDGGGLSAGKHDPPQALKIPRAPHGHGLGTDVLERAPMLGDVTLEGKNSYAHLEAPRAAYQPRSARCWSSADDSNPAIASPSPRLTFATMAASS